MDFLNYTCFVEGLASEASKVDFNARLLTGILGLTGEAAECVEVYKIAKFEYEAFDFSRFVDECSDLMWYVAFTTIAIETPLALIIEANKSDIKPQVDKKDPVFDDYVLLEAVMNVSWSTGKCADIVKKYLFHGKPFNKEKFIETLNEVVKHISGMMAIFGLSIQDVVDANVLKLKDRYKTGKFTFEEFMKKETV